MEQQLIDASKDGNLGEVVNLLAKGVNPNIIDSDGRTPLYWASCHGFLEVAIELVNAGADPEK